MSWDSWEELRRKNEEHRKRVEAIYQERDKRLAEERKQAKERRIQEKERKKVEQKKREQREEKKRKRIEQSNSLHEKALNKDNGGLEKEKSIPQVSLNRFVGMRNLGFSGGSQGVNRGAFQLNRSSGSSINVAGKTSSANGGVGSSGGNAPGDKQRDNLGGANQAASNKIVFSALRSGFRN